MPASSSSVVVYLITGASRGLGRAIASFAGRHHTASESYATTGNGIGNGWKEREARFLLVARSATGLEDTRKEILSAAPETNIFCRSMDLSDLDRLDSNLDILLNDMNQLCLPPAMERQHQQQHQQQQHQQHNRDTQKLVFVNNAASLGHLGPAWKSPSLKDMRQTIDLNVTSSLWMSVRFARYAKEFHRRRKQKQELLPHPNEAGRPSMETAATIVNISSLVAVSPNFPGMGIYSAGKAAREMYHTVLAREEEEERDNDNGNDNGNGNDNDDEETPSSSTAIGWKLKYLNYAPGPLETSMTEELRTSEGKLDEDLRSQFESDNMLDPMDSARKLIRLIETDDFESGSHVDYYDLPD